MTSSPSLLGRQLGAYRIDAAIGAGGMGEVYRATDTRLGRDVAVKILPPSWAPDPQRRTRFEREARAVAALNHPHICTIHDVGHDQGIDFLVMELVDGESLATRLAKGPLPLPQALARAVEIADALDRAHHQGIVHRDLKPGNVMLTRARSGGSYETHAKLLDFGLARIMPAPVAAGVEAATDTSPMTEVGALLGTLQYMAPEQIEGQPADTRSDIFSFGALLYEMVTGRRAFDGASTAALIAAIIREDPPPLEPRALGRIVRRCLAKDPGRRYQSARDLLMDLEEVKDGLDARDLVPSDANPSRDRRFGKSVAAALALAAIGTALYIGWPRPSAPPAIRGRFNLQPPPGIELVGSGPNSVFAFSPDGQWIAFRGTDQANQAALYLRHIEDLDAKKVAAGGTVPFFSPDSRWLGFFAEKGMYKVAVDGTQPQRICAVPTTTSVRGASWAADQTIVFSNDRALWRVDATQGEPAQLAAPDDMTRYYWPQVLPGGETVLFTINRGNNDRFRQAALLSLATREIRTLPSLSGTSAQYVDTGHVVYSRFGTLYAAPFDLGRLEVMGEPVKVLDHVNTFAGPGSTAFGVATTGALAYIHDSSVVPRAQLVWLDSKGDATPLSEDWRSYVGAALDPGSRRIAAAIADALGESDLWTHEIERKAWTRLTTGMQVGTELAWSPDGNWIYFTSFKSGEAEIFRIPSTGGRDEQLTSDPSVWEHPGSVSPDGITLLFWQSSPSQGDLMTLTLNPVGTPKRLTDSSAFESGPRISPDGQWVAYSSDETGSGQVHVRPFPGPGASIRVSPDGGVNPQWSRDGRQLFYQRGATMWAVGVEAGATFKHGAPRRLFESDFRGRPPFLVPGSGDRFLSANWEQPNRRLVYIPNWVEELRRLGAK
jgi:serine/threonine protein kinase/Tol biopolymer transport system component